MEGAVLCVAVCVSDDGLVWLRGERQNLNRREHFRGRRQCVCIADCCRGYPVDSKRKLDVVKHIDDHYSYVFLQQYDNDY